MSIEPINPQSCCCPHPQEYPGYQAPDNNRNTGNNPYPGSPGTPGQPGSPDQAGNAQTPADPDEVSFNDAMDKARNGGEVDVGGGGPNQVVLNNTTNAPMQIEFRGNNGVPPEVVTVPAGGSVTANLPEGWSGNARKLTPGNDYANLAEFSFENGLYFDESNETGRNASIYMQTPESTAGSTKSILGDAPEGSYTYDSEGNKVLLPSKTNPQSYDWLTQQIGPDNTYIHSEDHSALRYSSSNVLTVTFGEA